MYECASSNEVIAVLSARPFLIAETKIHMLIISARAFEKFVKTETLVYFMATCDLMFYLKIFEHRKAS